MTHYDANDGGVTAVMAASVTHYTITLCNDNITVLSPNDKNSMKSSQYLYSMEMMGRTQFSYYLDLNSYHVNLHNYYVITMTRTAWKGILNLDIFLTRRCVTSIVIMQCSVTV